MTPYCANTTDEKLKVARALLVQARRELWDIDEGKTTDDIYTNTLELNDGQDRDYYGMHPDVNEMQKHIDYAIIMTATMQDR